MFGGLGPDERLGVLVPCVDPVADVAFERLHAAVVRALQEILGEVGEPALDLVDPAAVGRGCSACGSGGDAQARS